MSTRQTRQDEASDSLEGDIYAKRKALHTVPVIPEPVMKTNDELVEEVKMQIASESPKASDAQVGGNHYKNMAIQPVEFITKNNIGFVEGCVIKYVCRHEFKNGVEDIDKAIHFLKLLKEFKYECS